jgi:integrase/recombinase XerD
MGGIWQKEVGKKNIRKYAANIVNLYLGSKTMSKQAKTLTSMEIRRVLDFIATRKHAVRNRAMVLTTFLSGLRVGEVAALRYMDILDADEEVRSEVRLDATQTKGNEGRVVFINAKLQKELAIYVKAIPYQNLADKLFYTQKNEGFTANTLTQFFHYLYRAVGIEGASSHSGRRTFITNLASKGVGVRVLMELSGHKNISTTQAYIDVNDDMMRKAVELI